VLFIRPRERRPPPGTLAAASIAGDTDRGR
jgi:hypothetical protein